MLKSVSLFAINFALPKLYQFFTLHSMNQEKLKWDDISNQIFTTTPTAQENNIPLKSSYNCSINNHLASFSRLSQNPRHSIMPIIYNKKLVQNKFAGTAFTKMHVILNLGVSFSTSGSNLSA
jgi:hypothetical protein